MNKPNHPAVGTQPGVPSPGSGEPIGYAVVSSHPRIVVQVLGEGANEHPVTRVGLVDLWVALGRGASLDMGEEISVRLKAGYREIGPLTALVQEIQGPEDPADGGRQAHLELLGLPLSRGREMCGLTLDLLSRGTLVHPQQRVAVEETIDRPDRIFDIVRSLFHRKAECVVRTQSGGLRPVDTGSVREDEELPFSWILKGAWPEPPFSIEAPGFTSVYHLHVEYARRDGDSLVTALPSRIVRLRRRRTRRVSALAGLTVSYRHPLWPELDICRNLYDLSPDGLSLWSYPSQDLPCVGLVIPQMDMLWNGLAFWTGAGVIRSFSEIPGHQGSLDIREAICGAEVSHGSAAEESRWHNLVDQMLHPKTRRGAVWTDSLWETLRSSGYFELSGKTPAEFDEMGEAFSTVSRRFDAAPWTGCQVVWPSQRGVEGTFTSVKMYDGTWFGCQLARRHREEGGGDGPGPVVRDLFSYAFEYAQRDPALKWVAGYLEADVRWNREVSFPFARGYTESGDGLLFPFRLLEVGCADHGGAPAAAALDVGQDIEIGPAREEEIALLLDRIAQDRPTPFVEALDLVPERFAMENVTREWKLADLDRERGVLVARRDGTPLAAAVMETGESGVSLFRLVDGLRFFPLAEGSEELRTVMLDAAKVWYAERGKGVFLYYCEDEEWCSPTDEGVRDLGMGALWILSAGVLPDFLEYLHTGPLAMRPRGAC